MRQHLFWAQQNMSIWKVNMKHNRKVNMPAGVDKGKERLTAYNRNQRSSESEEGAIFARHNSKIDNVPT